jgi:hypothetical protein
VTSSDVPVAAPAEAWARLGAAGDLLRRIIEGGRRAPAYLFEGPDLLLPREGARTFAAAILCAADARPCGRCASCRRVAAGIHPDVHVQGRDKATVISVEALAALLERAHASPLEGDRQVFVVEPADALAPEAVARYLKTLEEPPVSTTFVLVTARPDRLSDAVRSRCQRLRFPAPSEADVVRRLLSEGVEPERARRVARLAGGGLARAVRIARARLDEAVDATVAAALAPTSAAATAADRGIADLRARLAASGEAVDPETAEGAAEPAAGEAVRVALEDLFHALVSVARDRAAGRAGGPMSTFTDEDAGAALEGLEDLLPLVRRNLAPVALWTEAVARIRRAGPRRKDR